VVARDGVEPADASLFKAVVYQGYMIHSAAYWFNFSASLGALFWSQNGANTEIAKNSGLPVGCLTALRPRQSDKPAQSGTDCLSLGNSLINFSYGGRVEKACAKP
jgi:hypothetical protein